MEDAQAVIDAATTPEELRVRVALAFTGAERDGELAGLRVGAIHRTPVPHLRIVEAVKILGPAGRATPGELVWCDRLPATGAERDRSRALGLASRRIPWYFGAMAPRHASAAPVLPSPLEEQDPVWAAALNAPLCTAPPTDEELASFEEVIADFGAGRGGVSPEEIRAAMAHR